MTSIRRRALAVLCVLALLAALLPPMQANAAESYVLPVFETSDIHGYLADTAHDDAADYQYRLAYIADKVDDARGGDASKTVLLDGGDIYQGNVVSNLQDGWPMSAAFDAMEYDAVALGNHEFDWGIEMTTDEDGTMPDYTLNGTIHENRIPILCSNLYEAGTSNRVDFTRDYVILDKTATASDGSELPVKVAVIGYAVNYASSIMASRFENYRITSSLSSAERLAAELKQTGQADAAILLVHGDASSLAGQLSSASAFDLVCGGHSHTAQTGVQGTVAYIQASSQASTYARASLCFDGEGQVTVSGMDTMPVSANKSLLLDTPANQEQLAADVLAISHTAIDGVQEALQAELGYITTSITSQPIDGNSMCSTAGNWLTDLMNRATGAQVSFTNTGGIRTSFYVDGERRTITKGDIYTITPFGNHLYVYEIAYAELPEVLSYALRHNLRMSGVDCYYQGSTVNALVVDGQCIYKNGWWADGWAEKTVRICANEYVATYSGSVFDQMNDTDKFVNADLVDSEAEILALQEEAARSGGLLSVDTRAHFLEGQCPLDVTRSFTVRTSWEGMGTVTPTQTVAAGSQVTVSFTPAEGYEVGQVLVDGLEREERTQVAFHNIQRDHTVHVVFTPQSAQSLPFTDVSPEAWYYDEVEYVYRAGLMVGEPDGRFLPEAPMTRAMLVTVLWRLDGEKTVQGGLSFSDVSDGDWYAAAVAWGSANEIVLGDGKGHFAPHAYVTREQIAAFLYRYAASRGLDVSAQASLQDFPDGAKADAWAVQCLGWAVESGLITGSKEADGRSYLLPLAQATRCQTAAMLMRFAESF